MLTFTLLPAFARQQTTTTQQKAMQSSPETTMPTHHASGSFQVTMKPLPSSDTDGFKKMSFDKQLHGGLEGVSKGEMLTAGDPKTGNAGYVAMERITGTLDGKAGSFAMQHNATMGSDGQHLQVVVVPGSGSGALVGLAGTLTITIANGQHSYDFVYTLSKVKEPAPK